MHTIEDGAGEVRQELEEHVLFLGGQLVPASLLAAQLNIVPLEALLHVGVQPVVGSLEAVTRGTLGATRPPVLLLGHVVVAAANGGGAAAIAILRDVADEIAILALVVVVVGDGLLGKRVAAHLLFGIAVLELIERSHGVDGEERRVEREGGREDCTQPPLSPRRAGEATTRIWARKVRWIEERKKENEKSGRTRSAGGELLFYCSGGRSG